MTSIFEIPYSSLMTKCHVNLVNLTPKDATEARKLAATWETHL